MSYYFNKILKGKSFDEAVEYTKAELKKEGFGVLTEIVTIQSNQHLANNLIT